MGWISDMIEICIIQKNDKSLGVHINPLIKMCEEEPDEAKDALLSLSKLVQKHDYQNDSVECFILGALFMGYKIATENLGNNNTPDRDIDQMFPIAARCTNYLENHGWLKKL